VASLLGKGNGIGSLVGRKIRVRLNKASLMLFNLTNHLCPPQSLRQYVNAQPPFRASAIIILDQTPLALLPIQTELIELLGTILLVNFGLA
jgi:hypothetical protein